MAKVKAVRQPATLQRFRLMRGPVQARCHGPRNISLGWGRKRSLGWWRHPTDALPPCRPRQISAGGWPVPGRAQEVLSIGDRRSPWPGEECFSWPLGRIICSNRRSGSSYGAGGCCGPLKIRRHGVKPFGQSPAMK
jgi:hypothetical protein